MSLLEVDRLAFRRGDRVVLEDVSFSVERGEAVALMGPSGSGKSTILRVISGLEPVGDGHVAIDGVTLRAGPIPRGATLRHLHDRVGIVFQFHHLFVHKTALENVWLAPVHARRQDRPRAEARARTLLAELGVEHRASAYPHELSGGEAQRVAIARALATDPPLLLMDEPTASLDPERRGELAEALRQLAHAGRSLLVATHDVEFARAVATRTVVLDSGRVVRDCPSG